MTSVAPVGWSIVPTGTWLGEADGAADGGAAEAPLDGAGDAAPELEQAVKTTARDVVSRPPRRRREGV
jgi:hypothetical protein